MNHEFIILIDMSDTNEDIKGMIQVNEIDEVHDHGGPTEPDIKLE